MPASLFISLNHLAAALLGTTGYLYWCRCRGGYWKATTTYNGCRIERDHRDPYQALAEVAAIVQQAEATTPPRSTHPAYLQTWHQYAHLDLSSRHAAAASSC